MILALSTCPSYQWLKKGLVQGRFEHYHTTESGILTFDPFSPEDNGHYVCQAEVTSDFTETKKLLVEGKVREFVGSYQLLVAKIHDESKFNVP